MGRTMDENLSCYTTLRLRVRCTHVQNHEDLGKMWRNPGDDEEMMPNKCKIVKTEKSSEGTIFDFYQLLK